MEIDIKQVSLFGMELQRARVEAASVNIANAQLVFGNENEVFMPLEATVNNQNIGLSDTSGLQVSLSPQQSTVPKAEFNPEHQLANDQGYIFKPNINIATEMVSLVEATRAYEANVRAFNTFREMGAKALEIGK